MEEANDGRDDQQTDDLFGGDLVELSTGQYAIPEGLTDGSAQQNLDSYTGVDCTAEIVKELTGGRLALYSRDFDSARKHFEKAARMGSEEGKFLFGWLNVNTLLKSKGEEMSEDARERVFENLRYMVKVLNEYRKPHLIFQLYETLGAVAECGCLEIYSDQGDEKTYNKLLQLLNHCLEDEDDADALSTLLAFLRGFTTTKLFMQMESEWKD